MSAGQTGTFRSLQCQSQKAAHAKLTKASVIIERDFARKVVGYDRFKGAKRENKAFEGPF